MFASLSSIADRNFVVGFFLPVLIFTIAVLGLFHDVPPINDIWTNILDLDKFASLTVLAVALWCGALLLQLFNMQLYRILEGYLPPFNDEARTEAKRTELEAAQKRRDELEAGGEDTLDDWLDAREKLQRDFPPEAWQVLPTRFGNVLRAFETYPAQVYGIDGVSGWLRLAAVIPESFAATLNAARADVDFFVNLCFLAFGFAVLSALRCIFTLGAMLMQPWLMADIVFVCLVASLIAAGIAYLAYRAAILRAYGWGDLVRTAFDLYLPDLAKQLGYTLPASSEGRLDFWDDINSLMLYSEPFDPAKWSGTATAAPPPAAAARRSKPSYAAKILRWLKRRL